MANQKKRAPRRPRRRAPRKGRKAPVAMKDMASVVARTASINLTGNKTWFLYNFALTNSDRAKQVAGSYQEYRIAKVECVFKPLFDTFQSSTTSTLGVPTMYAVVDKQGSFVPQYTDLYALKQAGVKARRLDDKIIKYSFAPAILLDSSDSGSPPGAAPLVSTAGQIKVSPWLPTNASAGNTTSQFTPNSVDHRGIVFYVETPGVGAGVQPIGTLEVVLHYQFRKPLAQAPTPVGDDTWAQIDADTMTEVEKAIPLGKVNTAE